MNFLLDTNAVSEPGRAAADPKFVDWFESTPEPFLHLSVITLGELRRGVALMPEGAKKQQLASSNAEILRRFERRVIAVTHEIAELWGDLSADLRRRGRPGSMADEIIAATALALGLTVVSRETAIYVDSGCRVVSPWTV